MHKIHRERPRERQFWFLVAATACLTLMALWGIDSLRTALLSDLERPAGKWLFAGLVTVGVCVAVAFSHRRRRRLLEELQEEERQLSAAKADLKQRDELLKQLQAETKNAEAARGMVPICAACKKVRDTRGDWQRLELYFWEHGHTRFTHGMCPECMRKYWDLGG